jgi:mannose-6-phosphate isomerase-like protein (cupin superfamily)
VLLEAGDGPGLTNFSQAIFRPGDRVADHTHEDMSEVFFVREGRGRIRIDGVEREMVRDECWVVEPGETHGMWNDSENDLVLLYFGLISPLANSARRGLR